MQRIGDRLLTDYDLHVIKQALQIHRSILEASKPEAHERAMIMRLEALICAIDDEAKKRSKSDDN